MRNVSFYYYCYYDLVDHNFAQNGEKEAGLAGRHGRSSDVEIATTKIVLALDVDAGLEEALVIAIDLTTRPLGQQIGRLQTRFVGNVDGKFLQIGLVVAVSSRLVYRQMGFYLI